jgi:hypothetical protein
MGCSDDGQRAEARGKGEAATVLVPFDFHWRIAGHLRNAGLQPHLDEIKRFQIGGGGFDHDSAVVVAQRSRDEWQSHGEAAFVLAYIHPILFQMAAEAPKTVLRFGNIHTSLQNVRQCVVRQRS